MIITHITNITNMHHVNSITHIANIANITIMSIANSTKIFYISSLGVRAGVMWREVALGIVREFL